MSQFHTVVVSPDRGPVSVRIIDETHPQIVTGVVWQWDSHQQPLGQVGTFSASGSTVLLGEPGEIHGRFFGIVGGVLAPPIPDDPPTPYRVSVTVIQSAVDIDSVVPADGGSGLLEGTDRRFTHYFVVDTP